jgi:hypothetical protein
MISDIQDELTRTIDPPQPQPPEQMPPGGPPSPPSPRPEIPREAPPDEIPAKPQRDLPRPEPERADRRTHQLALPRPTTLVPLALAGMSLFVLQGCAVVEGIFKAGFGVGVLVVVTIVAVIGGVVALVTRK